MSYKVRVDVASRLVLGLGVGADDNEWAHLTDLRAVSDKNIRSALIVVFLPYNNRTGQTVTKGCSVYCSIMRPFVSPFSCC